MKVKAQVGLWVFGEGASMSIQVLVVKALSVTVILGMKFQKKHVKAIYPATVTYEWNRGGLKRADIA